MLSEDIFSLIVRLSSELSAIQKSSFIAETKLLRFDETKLALTELSEAHKNLQCAHHNLVEERIVNNKLLEEKTDKLNLLKESMDKLTTQVSELIEKNQFGSNQRLMLEDELAESNRLILEVEEDRDFWKSKYTVGEPEERQSGRNV